MPSGTHKTVPIILRPKRWTHDNSHLKEIDKEHNHPWLNNAWYRYVHDRVHREDNAANCYVCSHMPTTALHATVYGKPPTKAEALCIYDKAITGTCSTPGKPVMVIGGSIKDQNSNTCHNTTQYIVPQSVKSLIYNITNCTHQYPNINYTCNEAYWVHINVSHRKLKSFSVVLPPDIQHPVCFNFTGATGQTGTPQGLKKLGQNRNCSMILVAPDWDGIGSSTGTYWVQGAAWACGLKVYFMLPPNSTGLCAPVLVSDHTFKMSVNSNTRAKRNTGLKPHDPYLGSDVPDDFKLWTKSQKVIHALFPWIGVGKHALQIETLDYRFGLFLNASTRINQGQNEEIDAIRITVMQHRVALDIILAEKGGLCVLFNTTCCTYIPDNIHSLNMTNALNVLKQLSGSWKSLLIKGLLALFSVMLLFCLFIACIIPCLRSIMTNMFQRMLGNHVLAQSVMEDPYRQYDMLSVGEREENLYDNLDKLVV
ncbi:uncharacterized protein LOC121812508 [Haplochromis burtoni]|uniref:uncharacterized protein LOC121812508 n=1 Tax=Haplochromis burtoni TaxID=8153 RepID=UPI001C2D5835|nr:uncharacterized protein LOC121812508 [Haplochromis burtoni]